MILRGNQYWFTIVYVIPLYKYSTTFDTLIFILWIPVFACNCCKWNVANSIALFVFSPSHNGHYAQQQQQQHQQSSRLTAPDPWSNPGKPSVPPTRPSSAFGCVHLPVIFIFISFLFHRLGLRLSFLFLLGTTL